ncbi:RAN GTPase-activating protein 2-like [Wolffia australiana]
METTESMVSPTFQHRTFSIKLWPTSQATRLVLVERIAKNLSTESIFSRKYGLLSKEEATKDAKEIEEAGFAIADEHFKREPDGDGSSAVQLYAKETSKFMLQVLKRGPRAVKPVKPVKPAVPGPVIFDISGGKRAFIDAQEAEQLLAPLTEKGNAFTRICFSNRSFGIEAARVAAPILQSVAEQLTEVDLSDFVAGRPEEEALDVMRAFATALEGSKLRYLNLSDNALGEKGVRAFGPLLRTQTCLEELYLINDGISGEAANAVAELVPATDRLRVLHFHNNMTGDEGAAAIAGILRRSPELIDFRCSSTRVDCEGGTALAEALLSCPLLRKIDIRDNMFGAGAARALSQTIAELPAISELYLSYLNLEVEGAVALFKALEGATCPLTVLEIAGNEISAAAAPALCSCIHSKPSLEKLNLSENELGDTGAVILGNALESRNPKLMELDVSTNSLRRAGARCLARAAASRPGFVLLNINGNAISDEGLDEVREILHAGLGSLDALGPLDENDVEGEPEEEEEEEEELELESKLQRLCVDQ